ncbi:MAG: carboxylating nicotinate-nucleotide diphosphorylase [Pirellulaceae bacterium]
MPKDFATITWDARVEDDCRQLVRLAVREDLDRRFDWTTLALVTEGQPGEADVVARSAGVVAGLRAVPVVLDEMEVEAEWRPRCDDGAAVEPGQVLASIAGEARDLLTCERVLLNLVGRLSGVATLTRRHVEAIAGTAARIYDTRKTTPGWRRLEKYAVHCGGGANHRTGLFDAVLIKDNHLAIASRSGERVTPHDAVLRARRFVEAMLTDAAAQETVILEVEVDTLDQLRDVLPAAPDIVLLDNMSPHQLRQAVALRDELAPRVQLEASGGIDLSTIRAVAESGVERISVGALTHSAISLDVALDWRV